VPGGGLLGTCGVESGKAAPLVGGPPGVLLHTVVDGLPSEDTGDMVPVELPTNCVGMAPNAVPGVIVVNGIVVVDGITEAVLPAMDVEAVPGTVDGTGVVLKEAGAEAVAPSAEDCTGTVEPGRSEMNDEAGCADNGSAGTMELPVVGADETVVGAVESGGMVPVDIGVTVTAGVPGAICPVGVEQVTTVPGVVGSEARGTGARVVSGEFDWVVAENGPGPLSGDVTIVPGVVGSPMAVLPMVETCARQALQLVSKIAAVVTSKCRIAIASSAPI
jgi:hypothetical protein